MDPNPLVAGNGLQVLRQSGLDVRLGVLEKDARRLNEAFFKYIVARQPFVTSKTAMSLDGKIATRTGDSRWITGPDARNQVQHLRMENDAILVGIGTVLADDPLLTVRLPGTGKQPLRVVADSCLRIPPESQLVQTAGDYPTVVAGVQGQCPIGKREILLERGVSVWELPGADGLVDIAMLLRELGSRDVVGLLLEGGSYLNASFLKAQAIDKHIFFFAPKIIGGKSAPGPFGGEGVAVLSEAPGLRELEYRMVGVDLMITCYPKKTPDYGRQGLDIGV
jgi:diaminohydroxyphosphoribosylaminopyrimidine deaminase/5-amino-6-(5-phosphoribosylamino)uracil reductase